MTDEMVERVSTAICKAENSDVRAYGDEICCQFAPASRRREGGHNEPARSGPLRCCREDYEDSARAAIAAMRTPTEAMLIASGTIDGWQSDDFQVADAVHIEWWHDMIDAALEGK